MQQRSHLKWKKMLLESEIPAIDPAVNQALLEFVAMRKASMDDAWY
jgi:trimethylamine--corrinoid protein Co-methyltransferase